jgi:hypothetical protein
MNDFSLDNFKNNADEPKTPDWVQQGTAATLTLYNATLTHITELENRIKAPKGKDLSILERKLVNAKIAETSGLKKSNFRPDRQRDLLTFIETENLRLSKLWENTHGKGNDGRKLFKVELERLKTEHENTIEEIQQENLADYFHAALASEVLHEHKRLSNEISQLKLNYNEAQVTIANLRKTATQLTKQLNRKDSN